MLAVGGSAGAIITIATASPIAAARGYTGAAQVRQRAR